MAQKHPQRPRLHTGNVTALGRQDNRLRPLKWQTYPSWQQLRRAPRNRYGASKHLVTDRKQTQTKPDPLARGRAGLDDRRGVLEAAGAEVHLALPLGVKAFTYRRVKKNDERDAADLADLLRTGRLAEAWIAPRQVRELRELTRYRHKLVHLRSGQRR
jgi:hypothetical protein